MAGVTSSQALPPFPDLVKLELQAGYTPAVEFFENKTGAVAGMRIVTVAAGDAAGSPFSQFGLYGPVHDVQGVKALLAVAETRILGGRVGQRLRVVALPAETVGFLAVAEILLPGIGEGQEPDGIGAVGLVAGAAASVRDGRVDGLPGEPSLLVTAQTEDGDLGAEELLHSRRVGAMTAGASPALDGAMEKGVGGAIIVALAADPG